MGAIHLTTISGNSGTKSNGTERFWKFVSKIVDNLRRLSFFLEIWKFWKFPVPFGISTRFESTPIPLVVKSYKMAASKSVESTLHWMQNDLPRLEPVLDRKRKRFDLIAWKIVDWLLRRNFLWVSSPGLHTLSLEKYVSFSHKYQGIVEF